MADLMLQSLVLSFLLLGIHAYFGLEIVRRGIIFTDIAVAQLSAAGLALSLLLFDRPSQLLSLALALLGSLLVALSQRRREYSEAFIGLLYALSLSSVVLILSRSPRGMEDFLRLTASDILLVPREDIVRTGLLFLVFGVLLYLRRFVGSEILKEVSFFSIFALTVTTSVKLAGVLVVFSMLVAPALVSLILGRSLIFAWVYGSLLNIVGLILAFYLDLPAGFFLVFLHALAGILIFLIRAWRP